ncbi:hypothetical protein [Clostridium fungisolvens]|uniref:Uncharacterized protein n=1 Tax=Clostridium fungisolvens TaxID=1604897 RepID=A0A6V8SAG8_9CLOT|nr:hypothetical protein [Clostridium fungisolvens]GFP74239.1 hypothetical protein bsdtw1_00284 [Clostridium fungisolvens]
MNTPNYVLKTNEALLVPKDESGSHAFIRRTVLIIVSILLIFSFVFHGNLFSPISWGVRLLLIFVGIKAYLWTNNERVPSPIQLQFYDDYIIVYREKHYYNKNHIRKEIFKFYYKDIETCKFRTATERINIIGVVEGIFYDYNKDGSLPNEPTYHRTTDGGICFFYTSAAPEVDFVAEIENHSSIKVVIENS